MLAKEAAAADSVAQGIYCLRHKAVLKAEADGLACREHNTHHTHTDILAEDYPPGFGETVGKEKHLLATVDVEEIEVDDKLELIGAIGASAFTVVFTFGMFFLWLMGVG